MTLCKSLHRNLNRLRTDSFSSLSSDHNVLFQRAAKAVSEADALYITAGAGMGVDSGLPDFRSNDGFWRAYPPLKKLGIEFSDMANPSWFDINPKLAWGFYGHRLKLYETTTPHDGYTMLLEMAKSTANGYFVYTSNVDGHFFKSGYDAHRVVECHGSIYYLQSTINDGSGIIGIEKLCALQGIDYHKEWLPQLEVKEDTFEIADEAMIPRLRNGNQMGAMARPNILMFGDAGFETERVYRQYQRLEEWKKEMRGKGVEKICVIEMGAGQFVPRVRYDSDSWASSGMVDTFIRINVSENDVGINPRLKVKNKISLPFGALFAIQTIYDQWRELKT